MDSNFLNKLKAYELNLHGVRLPSFDIDDKYKRQLRISEDASNFDFLKHKCYARLEELKKSKVIAPKDYKQYKDRTDQELKILEELDFVDYILLVWHVTNFCDENKIARGRGRGSAAGSLVLYLIDVTRVDPIEYGLYFQRFVSKVRAKKNVVDGVVYLDGSLMADIDLDICYYNRQKVIEHLEQKFTGKTSKILTLNTLSGKLVIKECGKIVSNPDPKTEEEMNMVSSMIPKMYGNVKDIKETYEEVEDFREWCDQNKKAYETALKLRGLIKNKGVHASAIAISYDKLEDICPTELTSDKSSSVTSYDMNWVSLFNVKLDVLGLRGVSVVDRVCQDLNIESMNIDISDRSIYQELQDLKTRHGLFHIEADTAYKVCRTVTPENLEELSAVLAIARPGALQFENPYAEVAHGESDLEPIHPFFDEILKETKGVVLYQEQLMRMANKMGFSLDEAELLRRIVGKKKVAEVKKWKKRVQRLVKKNKDLQQKNPSGKDAGEVFWRILEDSANYSFNKSHSISYASLSAQTVYLKFNHPKEFFLNLLKMTRHESNPITEISKIEKELRHFGMKLLPPHILKSKEDFSLEGNNIRFGLLSIKGISEKSIDKIKEFQDEYSGKFEIFQAAEEIGLNLGSLSALIQAGALDGSYSQSRSKIVLEAQLWKILTKRERQRCLGMAREKGHDLIDIINHLKSPQIEDGKPFIKESRYNTIKKNYVPYLQIYKQNSISENFANWYYEKSLLGYTYGVTLKNIFSDERQDLSTVQEIEDRVDDSRVTCVATIDKTYSGKSRKGNAYYKCFFSDESGHYQAMIFNKKMDKCKEDNKGLPKENNIVVIKGTKKDGGVIFADIITTQDYKIYTRLADLKG